MEEPKQCLGRARRSISNIPPELVCWEEDGGPLWYLITCKQRLTGRSVVPKQPISSEKHGSFIMPSTSSRANVRVSVDSGTTGLPKTFPFYVLPVRVALTLDAVPRHEQIRSQLVEWRPGISSGSCITWKVRWCGQ